MLKSIQSNNSPGHSHNGQTPMVDLSTDSCPGIILKRNNKMKNNYETQKELVRTQRKYQVKALKTFRGMDGIGVNVNLYMDGKKIGEVDDSGDGGGLRITYFKPLNDEWQKDMPPKLSDFLKSLGTYTNEEMGWDWDLDKKRSWDDEQFWNELITMAIAKREYKKDMKKVQVIDGNDKLCYYNGYTPHELEKPYKTKKGEIKPLHKLLTEDHGCKKILNLLPESESFDIWFKIIYPNQ